MAEQDIGLALQLAAEAHLDLVWEAFYAQEDQDDLTVEVPSPAFGPFCGCQTCVIREVLSAIWPQIEGHFG